MCKYDFVLLLLHRSHFYQFGEIQSITLVSKQNCAFVNFASRSAAEAAAEKSANKLTIRGQRLKVLWGKSMSTFEKSITAQPTQSQDYVEGMVEFYIQDEIFSYIAAHVTCHMHAACKNHAVLTCCTCTVDYTWISHAFFIINVHCTWIINA